MHEADARTLPSVSTFVTITDGGVMKLQIGANEGAKV